MRLSEHKLRQILRVKSKSRDNLICYCPACGKPEFGISISKDFNPFNCYRKKKCGITGNIRNLHKYLDQDYKDIFGKAEKTLAEINEFKKLEDKKEEDWAFPVLPERKMPVGFRRIYENEYLSERGYEPEDFEKIEVGETKLSTRHRKRLIIGIYQNGKRVAYISRTLRTKEDCDKRKIPRYLNSEDDFEKIIEGIDELNNQEAAILVEGHFDRHNVNKKLNLPDSNFVCLSTFGAKISYDQLMMLKHKGVKDLFIFFDPDVLKVIRETSLRLKNEFRSVMICYEKGYEDLDPGDMSREILTKIMANSKNFINFEKNTLTSKLL